MRQVCRGGWRAVAVGCALGLAVHAVKAADAPVGGAAGAGVSITAAAAEKVFVLDISAGKTPPAQQTIRVQKNDLVKLRLTSDTAGEAHLHAYRKDLKLVPGAVAEMTFKAHATGRFRIEWHAVADKGVKGGDGRGGDAKSGGHHAPPLAILEVRPQ